MKQQIETLLMNTLKNLAETGVLTDVPETLTLDPAKNKQFGDFASNIAMSLAKQNKKNPRELAALIIEAIPENNLIEKVEVAGPGFINIFLKQHALFDVVSTIFTQKEKFGLSKVGQGKKVLLEFVSSNPTGPLHVGHGRHGAFGSVVGNLLNAAGFSVTREYYVNDAGRQMDIIAVSVYVRYLGLCGEKVVFPANGYQGEYVTDIAKTIHEKHGKKLTFSAEKVFETLPPDEPQGGDKEKYIDALIQQVKTLLKEKYQVIADAALSAILSDMENDLTEFGVNYDSWFSERACVMRGEVDRILETFKKNGHVYEHEGALWFRSTDFGDEKDRVLVKSNGARTYFANDVAYHINKFERGYDAAINIFGSDHHGYAARIKASLAASGIDPDRLKYLWIQFVTLYQGGVQKSMSTRGGQFVTLRELRHEVGNDVARYFYVMRKSEQPIDFDLDLAKSQSNENPVYYLQYAYARIMSVFKQLKEKNMLYDESVGLAHMDRLTSDEERELLNKLGHYPTVIQNAAIQHEPHQLTTYLRELASDFHRFYNAHQFLVPDAALRNARLSLVLAVKQVMLNAFDLIGISAPESM